MDSVTLNKRIEAYYRGERISNAALMLIGAGAIAWTFILFYWRQGGHLSSGFFYSALPLGLFCIGTGGYRFLRSFRQFNTALEKASSEDYFLEDETPLIKARKNRFLQKRKVDMTGVLLGFCCCTIIALSQGNHIFLGTSITITLFSAILLVFDLFGQFRTEEYIHFLDRVHSRD